MTASDFSDGKPEWWDDAVYFDAQAKQFWSKHEGDEYGDTAIIRKDDTRIKKAGQKITFITVGQLYGSATTNESTLAANEEKATVGNFYVETGLFRHAVAYNEWGEHLSLFKMYKHAGHMLADWMARYKDYHMDYQLINTDYSSETTLFANDAADRTYLNSDCTFGVTEIERLQLTLETMGAEPLRVSGDGFGNDYPVYGVALDSFDIYRLKGDARWYETNAEANIRGKNNPLFPGAIGMIGGMIIYPRRAIRGMQGSYLRPSAKIYGSHTTGVSTITVGANNNKDYTQNFPSTGTLCILKNSTGAVEYVTYTGKTKYSFTGCSRAQTYGGSTSTAAEYTTGDFVAYGKFESRQIAFGARTAMRAHSLYAKEITQTEDYGMEQGIGIKTIFGDKALFESDDSVKNYCVMMSCSAPPGAATIS
jgi:N4-gp56 family major capsid protein